MRSSFILRAAIKDPWERREAWRYTGQFSRYNRMKGMFPGFGIATGAFIIYCAIEQFLPSGGH
ncbi:NADH-ubiquinone oxidoreductase B12 subunit family-domain-containing protein [Lipomyces oligophaga]|uniref:NADH-ubiquinone oxidoreductase B12 subunit family-domain-containing protein n=1 Tax=Lipomyces oligophaga TaxID=45792 RepID=UPI0034CD30B2